MDGTTWPILGIIQKYCLNEALYSFENDNKLSNNHNNDNTNNEKEQKEDDNKNIDKNEKINYLDCNIGLKDNNLLKTHIINPLYAIRHRRSVLDYLKYYLYH